jgi:predicted transcriptional regulator
VVKKDIQSQKEKFIAAARAAGCDESEEAFDAKLKALLTHKPMTQAEVKKKAKRKKLD